MFAVEFAALYKTAKSNSIPLPLNDLTCFVFPYRSNDFNQVLIWARKCVDYFPLMYLWVKTTDMPLNYINVDLEICTISNL